MGDRGFFEVVSMAVSRQRKMVTILLALYWPTLFVFAHIPIPRVVREAGVSDKSLHFFTYLTLIYLLWFAVWGDEKVNWRRAGPWWMLAIVAVYGILDEWSQGFVAGRSCDPGDFFADVAGTLTGLILFSVFALRPAGLAVAAAVIFGMTNVTRTDLADLMPVKSAMFHLSAYAIFTALWVQYIRYSRPAIRPPGSEIKRLTAALAAPTALLLVVKLFSVIFGRAFALRDMLISAGGIGAVVAAVYLTALFRRMKH
jgi:VanZ family protein